MIDVMVNVENMVVILNFHTTFDLEFLSENLKTFTEYQPEEHPWLKTWFGKEKKYVAFYQSGKCMIPGIGSHKELEKYLSIVEKNIDEVIDIDTSPKVEIKNIICSSDLGSSINLEKVAIGLGLEKVEYEPEQFPALIYRQDNNGVFLIFSSGKIVITGIQEKKIAEEALSLLKKQLNLI